MTKIDIDWGDEGILDTIAFCFGCGQDIGKDTTVCNCHPVTRDWFIIPDGLLGLALTDRLPANYAMVSRFEDCVVTQVPTTLSDEEPFHVFQL